MTHGALLQELAKVVHALLAAVGEIDAQARVFEFGRQRYGGIGKPREEVFIRFDSFFPALSGGQHFAQIILNPDGQGEGRVLSEEGLPQLGGFRPLAGKHRVLQFFSGRSSIHGVSIVPVAESRRSPMQVIAPPRATQHKIGASSAGVPACNSPAVPPPPRLQLSHRHTGVPFPRPRFAPIPPT